MKTLLMICCLAIAASAQTKLFITPMENNFDNFLSAAIIQKKIPVVITLDESNADYILAGTTTKGDNKWSDTIFGGEKDRNQGAIKLINPKEKTVVFATSAGDRNLWFGHGAGTGQKKVAERLADKLKEFFKKAERDKN